MIVTLKTQNGTMSVNLKEFFPASRSRVKKLFLLMGQGLTVEDKRKVKAYLLELQAGVEKDLQVNERNLASQQAELLDLEEKINQMKAQQKVKKENIAGLDRKIKKDKKTRDALPVWLQDFGEVCGEPISRETCV